MHGKKHIGNLGDVNPVHGSRYVYAPQEKTDDPYMEVVCEIEDVPEGEPNFLVYGFDLERFQLLEKDNHLYLVVQAWEPDWPYPLATYDEWFHEDLGVIAECCGTSLKELRRCFCSADAMERAFAWCCVGDYHGFENLDSYARKLTKAELEDRYADES